MLGSLAVRHAPGLDRAVFGAGGGWALVVLAALAMFGMPFVFSHGRVGIRAYAAGAVAIAAPVAVVALALERHSPGRAPGPTAFVVAAVALALAAGLAARDRAATNGLIALAVAALLALGPARIAAPLGAGPERSGPALLRPTRPSELRAARVELRGPVERTDVAFTGQPPLRIDVDLSEGESRTVYAWIVAPAGWGKDSDERPVVTPALRAPRDREEPVAVEVLGGRALDVAPDELPDLLLRARPPLDGFGSPVPWSAPGIGALCGAVALFVALGTTRSRTWIACAAPLGAGALGSAAVLAFVAPAPAPVGDATAEAGRSSATSTTVLEGRRTRAGDLEWARLERSRGPWSEPADRPIARAGGDARAGARFNVGRYGQTTLTGGAEIVRGLHARGPAVDRVEPRPDVGLRVLLPEVNTFGAFTATWTRSDGGAWTRRGAWAIGAPLPPSSEGPSDGAAPPEWARTGLTTAGDVFVGRLESGSDVADWVRVSGFDG